MCLPFFSMTYAPASSVGPILAQPGHDTHQGDCIRSDLAVQHRTYLHLPSPCHEAELTCLQYSLEPDVEILLSLLRRSLVGRSLWIL